MITGARAPRTTLTYSLLSNDLQFGKAGERVSLSSKTQTARCTHLEEIRDCVVRRWREREIDISELQVC